MKVDFTPASLTLLPVTTRGKTYPVPKQHRAAVVDSTQIVVLAEAGVRFYDEFLNAAEAFFVK